VEEAPVEDFKKLVVWTKAHELTLAVYLRTRRFPKEEMYGLTSQVRRASASIGANIAEGGRRSDAEMKRFLQIARGSASEVECHPVLARDLQFLAAEDFRELEQKIAEVQRMLASLVQRLQAPVLARS
jgi:four helix bundle protein